MGSSREQAQIEQKNMYHNQAKSRTRGNIDAASSSTRNVTKETDLNDAKILNSHDPKKQNALSMQ